MSRTPVRSLALALFLAVAVIGTGTAVRSTEQLATPTAGTPAVVREVLGAGLPAAAPGQALQLVRYTIAPGTRLSTHTHPGMQVALIESGTLTYTVVHGEVPITRAANAGTPGATETLAVGQTTQLNPGDSFSERAGLIHFGQNDGAAPVVILVSSLLTEGQPPSTTVNDKGTPVSQSASHARH